MGTAFGDQERRCSNCKGLVSSEGDCPRCTGNPDQADLKRIGWYVQPIVEIMKCFLLPSEEAEAVTARLASDVQRHLPHYLRRATLSALLPLVQQRAQGYFLANDVPCCDAEDLAASLISKVLMAIGEKWPRGNVGSWISTIRNHLLYDYWRAKRIQERRFGKRSDAAALDNVESCHDAPLRNFVEEFPDSQQEIIERLLGGDTWREIEARYAEKAQELRKALLSMEWDGRAAPLRKKRRHRTGRGA
jgi:DNA-directed RNA polymerase specialized sigma24 family protein